MNDFHVKFPRREHILTRRDHFGNERKIPMVRLRLFDWDCDHADPDGRRHSGVPLSLAFKMPMQAGVVVWEISR